MANGRYFPDECSSDRASSLPMTISADVPAPVIDPLMSDLHSGARERRSGEKNHL